MSLKLPKRREGDISKLLPIKRVKPDPAPIIEFTKGKKSSSFRVIIPANIVNLMGLGKEEQFIVQFDPSKQDLMTLRRVTKSDLKKLLEGE